MITQVVVISDFDIGRGLTEKTLQQNRFPIAKSCDSAKKMFSQIHVKHG